MMPMASWVKRSRRGVIGTSCEESIALVDEATRKPAIMPTFISQRAYCQVWMLRKLPSMLVLRGLLLGEVAMAVFMGGSLRVGSPGTWVNGLAVAWARRGCQVPATARTAMMSWTSRLSNCASRGLDGWFARIAWMVIFICLPGGLGLVDVVRGVTMSRTA